MTGPSHDNAEVEVPFADRVLVNGAVYTVGPEKSWAQAVAITGKRITFVGDNEGAKTHVGPDTVVENLEGKLVLPGFVDCHAHPSWTVKMKASAELDNSRSPQACLDATSAFMTANPGAEVIYGNGWNAEIFPRSGPRKEPLDEITGNNPACLFSNDGHSIWANSAALEVAGITAATPDPDGGVIERNPDTGEPSGTLREKAMNLVANVLQPFSIEQLKEGIRSYCAMAAEEGITMTHDAMLILPGETDPMLGAGPVRHNVAAYSELAAEGRLTLRVRGSLLAESDHCFEQLPAMVEEAKKQSHPDFRTHSVKIFVDGVIEGQSAYLLEPYVFDPDHRGELIWPPDQLHNFFEAVDREGLQIHIHSVGDGAARLALDALERTRNVNGARDSRHGITHLDLVDEQEIPRFSELDVLVYPQAIWHVKGETHTQISVPNVGEYRAEHRFPMRSLIDAGARLAAASDFPVDVPSPPLVGIMTAITRHEPGEPDEVLWLEERVTLAEMIEAYTINGAYANFMEDETGSLEVGKLADVVVLERNLFEIAATEIADTKIVLTLFEGNVVHRADS